MARLKPFIIFLLAFQLISIVSALSKGKSHRQYNEQCVPYDASGSCDSSQGLICLDSGLKGYRCLCPSNKLHAQTFDTKRNACVGKVLNSCVRGSSKSSLNETLCVDHAECNTAVYGMAVCLCKIGFTEKDGGSGTCAPSLKHGDSCVSGGSSDEAVSLSSSTTPGSKSSDSEARSNNNNANVEGLCDEKHGQKCIDGKCQCRFPSEQYYDEKEGKCISYVSGRCSHDGHVYSCVPNAICPVAPVRMGSSVLPIGLPPLPQFLNAFAHASAGAASNGDEIFVMPLRPRIPPPHPPPMPHHRPTLHHHHPPYHYRPLGKEEPLMEFDTSYDNFDFVARSIFFGNKKKGTESGGESSEESANSADPNQPKCECLAGFTRTAAGYCMKGYGSKCNSNDDDDADDTMSNTTSSSPREVCNADQFLECMDAHDGSFTCQCRNQMNERYDLERKECVAMVGRRCRPLGNYPKCEKGSECINGICECANGTSLTPMETCAKDYDEKCQPGQCNVWKGLTCHGKSRTCMCLDSYLRFDQKKRSCVASKGSMCGSVRSNYNNFMSEMAHVDCEDGSECKTREVGGKKMGSMCM